MSDGKVIRFPGGPLPHGGTFSNVIDRKPLEPGEMMRNLKDAAARIKRMQMHVVRDYQLVLPPDWETSFPPWLVSYVKRRLGVGD